MPLARARADAARRRVGALASHAPLDLASTSARSSAPAPPPVVASLDDWEALVGGPPFGPGPWLDVDQARVDAFAECTGDHQWIHRAGAATPFGGPIAHGFLTLALLPALLNPTAGGGGVLPKHAWARHELNCGFRRVRFVAPVRVGARVRARASLVATKRIEAKEGGDRGDRGRTIGVESTLAVVVEADGSEKPAMVAEWITRQYGDVEKEAR